MYKKYVKMIFILFSIFSLRNVDFAIDTFPEEDIVVNTGLEVIQGESVLASTDELELDVDGTDNAALEYEIVQGPNYGQFEYIDNPGTSVWYFTQQDFMDRRVKFVHDGSNSDDSWVVIRISANPLTWGDSFTQQDLIDGKIRYIHDDYNSTLDSFMFKISDKVPNELTGQTFNISINPIDDDTPTISTLNWGYPVPDNPWNYFAHFVVYEGGTQKVVVDQIESIDSDTNDLLLKYTLTSPFSHGQIEYIDTPGVKISEFFQQDLYDELLRYVHDGSDSVKDEAIFSVADPAGNTLSGEKIIYGIIAVDDEAPNMTKNEGLSLDEETEAIITSNLLSATDTESDDATINFKISKLPSRGQLLLEGLH